LRLHETRSPGTVTRYPGLPERRSTQPLVLDQKSGRGPEAVESNLFTLNPLKAGRLSASQFTNRRSRTLFTSPSIKNIATIFDPPELISGRGIPVTGILPTTIPTFTNT